MTTPENPGALLNQLVDIMAKLRGKGGCPWDCAQTHASLRPYLIEETYEVLEALEAQQPAKVCEELGDLLLQIVFHAQIAAEQGTFTLANVIASENAKMIRRHPHVFGDTTVSDVDAVLANWEAIKAKEQGAAERKSLLDGIPKGLPALMHAAKIQDKAAKVGFEWAEIDGALDKVSEELLELKEAIKEQQAPKIEGELGDLLFALVNVARYLAVNPELALRRSIAKFERRFRYIEAAAAKQGKNLNELDLAAMDQLWEQAKAEETD